MKAIFNRVMSVSLVLAMLAVLICGVPVFAASTEGQEYTVYFENSDNWDQVYVYYWSDDNTAMVEWPGEPAAFEDGLVYSVQIPVGAQHVIFNNQGKGNQTSDLTIPGTGYIYSWAKNTWQMYEKCSHNWKENQIQEASCTQKGIVEYRCDLCGTSYQKQQKMLDHTYVNGACSACGKEEPVTHAIYFDNTAGWSVVNAYYWWDATQEEDAMWPEWPGVEMTQEAEGTIYSLQIPVDAEYVIFTNGTDQTDDLWIPGADQVYSYATGLWEELGGCIHQWNEGLVVWELTCTQSGVTLYSCKLCGDTYEDYQDATGHKFQDGICTICGGEKAPDVTVYFDNAKGWEKVYVYFWSDSDIGMTTWPGVEMTAENGGYSAQISGEAEFVIFNCGSNKDQSPDMWLPGDDYLFCMFSMEWQEFHGCFHIWEQMESMNTPTCTVAGYEYYSCTRCTNTCAKYVDALGHSFKDGACIRCGEDANAKINLYFDNSKNWEKAYIYYWSGDDASMTVWPGIEMTAMDGGYCAEIPAAAQYVIFSDGTSDNQTTDMWIPGDGWFYSMFIDDWAEFEGCFHNWEWDSWIYEPTCVEFGFAKYACTDCGLSHGWYANALGHEYADGKCSRCGSAEPEMITVYFDNTDKWDSVYVYYWPSPEAGYDTNWYFPSWPGVEMTHVEGTTYSVQIPVYGSELNFTDGGSIASEDLTVPGDGYLYSWRLKIWKETEPSQGAAITGSVTSYLDDAGEVTITLADEAGAAVLTQTVVTGNTASYTLEQVNPGTYTLKVSKAGHVTRAYTVTVEAENVTLDVKICPVGDNNNDGKVNVVDTARAYSQNKEGKLMEGYQFSCADIDGNGRVVIKDVAQIYAHVKGTKSLW